MDPSQLVEPSLYEKLSAVEEWIYSHGEVGTIDEPGPWIYGRIETAGTVLREVAFGGEEGAHPVIFGARLVSEADPVVARNIRSIERLPEDA